MFGAVFPDAVGTTKSLSKEFGGLNDVVEEDFEQSKGEAETLAGFILEISRSFPKKNQKIIFKNCTFTIENLDLKRIKQIIPNSAKNCK